MRQVTFSMVLGAALIAFMLVGLSLIGSPAATAAPFAAPTPVSANPSGVEPVLFTFWNSKSVAATATSQCFDLSQFNKADVYYSVDVTAANTLTLKLKFGNSETALVDGVTITTAATDTTGLNEYNVFGKYTCIGATVATTAPVVVSVNALGK